MVSGPLRALLPARSHPPSPQNGVTTVEYALMAFIIVTLLIVSSGYLFNAVKARFAHDESCATQAYTGTGC